MEIQTNERGVVTWIKGPFNQSTLQRMQIGIHFESGVVQPNNLSGRQQSPHVKLAVGESMTWTWAGYAITVKRIDGAAVPTGKIITLDKFQKAKDSLCHVT